MREEVRKSISGRRPAKRFRECRRKFGDPETFSALDRILGDSPDGADVQKTEAAMNLPASELPAMADAPNDALRRCTRLILWGKDAFRDETLLHRGLSDRSSRIRCDTVRRIRGSRDRGRLYNQLVRLLREDPDHRVRRAAGKRLNSDFADLYSLDFDGLPPLSRMFVLDGLEGRSRFEEKWAESLLFGEDEEAAFRAARCLSQWGTLDRYAASEDSEGRKVLNRAAAWTAPDDSDSVDAKGSRPAQSPARRGSAADSAAPGAVNNAALWPFNDIENRVFALVDSEAPDRIIRDYPLENQQFRDALAAVFPHPEADYASAAVYDLARLGQWREWTQRIAVGLTSDDPDIRSKAAAALAVLDPQSVPSLLADSLNDGVERVRRNAARLLAALPPGRHALAEHLVGSPESDEAVLDGLREAGDDCLVQCIIDNADVLDARTMGAMLAKGIDAPAAALLAAARIKEWKALWKAAGPRGGESLPGAWQNVNEEGKKRLLAGITASGWLALLPAHLAKADKREAMRIAERLSPMDKAARQALLQDALGNAGGLSRRRLKKLMKS